MPHIAIDASPALIEGIDWRTTLVSLHRQLSDMGWANLSDLKSRVQPIAVEFSGDDSTALQLIATLALTNPRPFEISQKMAETVQAHPSSAIDRLPISAWVQCCVFLDEHPKR
ncbi:hypothetical protein ACOTJH_28340 [Achromobacter xylosoxidans]